MSNKCRCDASADDSTDKEAESKNIPDEVTYEDPGYLKQLFAILNQFRCDEKYCDFFFCMEEQKICAHKVILSAASPFFNERFRDGCTCVEKEGTGKDGDDTPSAGDYRDDASLDDAGLDGAGLDGAGLDDVCLADTCLDDTFLHKGSAEGSKDQPVRERPSKDQTVRERPCKNFAGDQTMTSCNIDDQSLDSGVVSVTKEENIDPCFSDEPTVSFISDWRVIDAKRATEDETCCDNFSSYTSCDQVESIRSGSEKRKVARSLISRYMDEVLLHTNRTFSRVANKKCIDKGHCSCENDSLPQIYSLENAKQKTTEPQIYEDNPLVYPSVAKREIEKISLTTEYMDEPRSSVNNTPFPCGTNSIEEARGKRSYENTPAARAYDRKPESERVKEREDWSCDTKEEYRERKIRKKENETTPSCSCEPKEDARKQWVDNLTPYACDTKKENKDFMVPPTRRFDPEKHSRIPRTWPSKSTASSDTKVEERVRKWPGYREEEESAKKRLDKTVCSCDTKEEQERIRNGINKSTCCDTREGEARIGKGPSKPVCSCDTKEAKENIMKRPSKTTYSCDTKEEKIRNGKGSGNPLSSSCTTEEEERINKWPSKPELSNQTEENEERTVKRSSKARDIFFSETTEDEERMRKWPSNPILPSETEGEWRAKKCSSKIACFCDTNKGEKIKKWPNHSKPCVCSSDAKKDAERVEKRRSTAACWCDSEKENRASRIWSDESKKATSERGPDDGVKNMTAFCCATIEKDRRQSTDSSAICSPDTKGEEEVTGKYTGKTVLSDALKEDTEESEAWPSEPICTGENMEEIKAAPLKEREKWKSKNPFKFGSMKAEGEEKISCKCPTVCLKGRNNIKEAGRYARNRKEIKAAASCPCQPKISRTSAGTSIYPRDANEIKDTEDEVPLRKNMSFVCVPEVKEGTIKRLLWKGDTRDDVSIRTCKDVNAFNAKANFGRRWVCEGFNDWAVGPKCGCDVKKDAGYAFTDEIREIPIRKNKSFVCIPEIAAEGIERWTYKNMNTSSYSWSSGRTQGGGGPQWMSSDNDLASNSSTCKCSKCAPKPKMVPNEDDVRDVMFSDAIRKGVKFGNIVNIYSSCGKEYNPFAKYSDGCIPCTSREQKDDNMTAKLTDVCHPFTSDIEENTNEPTKVPVASTVACGVPCIKKEDIKGRSGMVQFEDIDICTLKQIIDFIYSGKLTINEKNVRNLLLASSLLQIDWITKKCFQFCKHRLNVSNCFSLRKLAAAYKRTDLCDRCDDYIYRNFLEVIDTDEYGLLCFEEVKDLLSSNEIVTDTEVSVFDGVLNWIKHCPSERLPLLLPLMNCVRLPIMSAKCLMTYVATEPYIKDNPECKDLLLDAMKYHLVPEKRYLMISERTQERKPSKMVSHVILAGANCCEGRMYDKNFTNCVCMARMKQRRCQAGVTSWHNLLYVVGGKDQSNSLKTAECYNALTNAWVNIPSMAAKHCNFGICSMYGLIYACGGHDGCSIHNYVECYDTLTSKWISCPAMKCSLDNTHASALDNCIYCMGTIGGLTNFERFDLREGIWCKMPSLLNYRKCSDMVSYGNYLFCMGGLSLDNRAQNTGERFDVRSNKWEHIAPMLSARCGHSMVEIDGNVYVIGGDHNLTVEYYNIGLNEWVQLESASIKHSFGGAAVVNCFPLK